MRNRYNFYTSVITSYSIHYTKLYEATTPEGYAYLKVAEGCGHNCTFCTIPSIRGRLASAPLPGLLDEARALIDQA